MGGSKALRAQLATPTMKFWAAEAALAAAAAAPTPLAPRLANHFRHPTTGGTPRGRTLADGVSVLALCICLTPVLLLTLTIRPSSGFQSSLQDQPAALLANPSSGLPSSGVSSTTTATNLGDLNIANGNLTPFNVAAMAFGGNQSRLTEEQSQAQYSDEMSLYMAIEIANSIIFVIGLCGNTIVILVILKFTKIETVTDIYILNLAFADLMFIMGLLFLNTTMHISQWIFGNLMCKLYMASTSLNQFASSLLLVVMSFDRFLAVCHPIYAQRFRRPRRAKIICLAIWAACLILMTPIFVFAKTKEESTCAIVWPEYESFHCEIVFTFSSFAIGFFVPLLLIGAFYLQVLKKLRVAAKGPIGLASTRRSRSRETANRRIEHLVIGIIFTYTICWLPYWVTQMYVSFTKLTQEQGMQAPFTGFYPLFLVATCLSYTNSALNPILYAFLSDNFKRRCSDIGRSIASFKWRHPFEAHHNQSFSQSNQATIVTSSCYEHSEAGRPDSRQTVSLNETARFIMASPHKIKLTSGAHDNHNWHQTRNLNCTTSDKHEQVDNNNNDQASGLSLVVKSTIEPIRACDLNNNNLQFESLEAGNARGESPNNSNNLLLADGHRKKSVNFSVDTVVVQDVNNNETTKGNHHTIIPIDNNNNNDTDQCQGV